MKLTIAMATRGRPDQAAASIAALRKRASGQHDIRVLLALDEDDTDTQGWFRDDASVQMDVAPRPVGVGACWNRLVAKVTDGLIVHLPDDAVITTPLWDECASQLMSSRQWPHPDLALAALLDAASPGQATMFVMTPGWVRHFGFLDTRYPFWFADTAIAETYTFVAGKYVPFLPIEVQQPPGGFNPRLRDMGLWWTLFAATRQERLQRAEKVRADLGIPTPANLDAIVASHQARDVRGLKDSILLVRDMPNRKAPDDAYLAARTDALWYLETHDHARHLTGERTAYRFAIESMEAE